MSYSRQVFFAFFLKKVYTALIDSFSRGQQIQHLRNQKEVSRMKLLAFFAQIPKQTAKQHMQHVRKHTLFFLPLILCLIIPVFSGSVLAGRIPANIELQLFSENNSHILAAVNVIPDTGYHSYAADAKNGKPFRLSANDTKAEIFCPQGHDAPDPLKPSQKTRIISGPFTAFAKFPASIQGKKVTLNLSLLLCSDKNCVPVAQSFVTIPPAVETLPPLTSELSSALHNAIPLTEHAKNLKAASAAKRGLSQNAGGTLASRLTALPKLSPRVFQEHLEPKSLWTALLLGGLAGLTLNIMPCVLPVLTLKLTSLLIGTGRRGSDRKRIRQFRQANIFFACGVLTWFAALAVLIAGAGLAWGGLFQRPNVIFAMIMLVVLLALSLFGLLILPMPGFNFTKKQRRPGTEAFISGITVTLLATPCSGPLLGGVLAWSTLQSPVVQFITFIGTGIGMALPSLMMAAFPQAVTHLPRSGAWMETAERIAGFFLLATALYLLSIFPENQRIHALWALLAATAAVWCHNKFAGLTAQPLRRKIGNLLLVASLFGCFIFATSSPPPSYDTVWHAFDQASFKSTFGRAPILLDFTADWCPTCKVIEKTTLNDDNMQKLASDYGLHLVKADLTRPNPQAEALLRKLGSVSIPLAAIFPAGDEAKSPIILRDIFTKRQLKHALRQSLKDSPTQESHAIRLNTSKAVTYAQPSNILP